jgi:hypothetical protein
VEIIVKRTPVGLSASTSTLMIQHCPGWQDSSWNWIPVTLGGGQCQLWSEGPGPWPQAPSQFTIQLSLRKVNNSFLPLLEPYM